MEIDEGFMGAMEQGMPPISVLSTRFGKYDIAQRLIASILQSKTANNRIKERTRDLKDQVLMEMKAQS